MKVNNKGNAKCGVSPRLNKMFNTTFNNISVISWLTVLLVEETGIPGENH
jgi:hypothetical protein